MKKFLAEFKEFALRGNVMNLAVGVIIGAAFQGVVTALTENILSPILGLFTRQSFDSLYFSLWGVPVMYGAFLTALINFVIMAFVVFLMVKGMNKLFSVGEKKTEKPKEKRTCPYCLTEIHLQAVRCPACTSLLDEGVAAR